MISYNGNVMKIPTSLFTFILCASLFANDDVESIKQGLQSADRSVSSAAIDSCVDKGREMLPQLREWAADSDPRLKARARAALGRITGQWASQTDVIWQTDFKKAVEKATAEKKPMLVLQLFGKLDEEFC